MQARSAEVRVFVNQREADARTTTRGNAGFAGSIGIFGMSGAPTGKAKGAKTKRSMGSHAMGTAPMRGNRFDLQLDVTQAVRAGLGRKGDLTLTLVAVGLDGKALAPNALRFDAFELHVG
jgi:ribosomal protein L3